MAASSNSTNEAKQADDVNDFELNFTITKTFADENGPNNKLLTYSEEMWFNTTNRMEFINVTPTIEQALKKSRIRTGFVLISPMHITASVLIQNDDKKLHSDFANYLERFVF